MFLIFKIIETKVITIKYNVLKKIQAFIIRYLKFFHLLIKNSLECRFIRHILYINFQFKNFHFWKLSKLRLNESKIFNIERTTYQNSSRIFAIFLSYSVKKISTLISRSQNSRDLTIQKFRVEHVISLPEPYDQLESRNSIRNENRNRKTRCIANTVSSWRKFKVYTRKMLRRDNITFARCRGFARWSKGRETDFSFVFASTGSRRGINWFSTHQLRCNNEEIVEVLVPVSWDIYSWAINKATNVTWTHLALKLTK